MQQIGFLVFPFFRITESIFFGEVDKYKVGVVPRHVQVVAEVERVGCQGDGFFLFRGNGFHSDFFLGLSKSNK